MRMTSGEDPFEHLLDGPRPRAGDARAYAVRELLGLLLHLFEEPRVGRAGGLEPPLVPFQRVQGLPPPDLIIGPVAEGVVGRGVRPDPVGDGLDQGRLAFVAGPRRRLLGRLKYGQHVVAVYQHTGETIGAGLAPDGGDRLRRQWDRDGPLVVLTEEHDRSLEDGGEVAALVDVALGGGAVAEVHE